VKTLNRLAVAIIALVAVFLWLVLWDVTASHQHPIACEESFQDCRHPDMAGR
jgi:hypothetical protein